MSTGLSPYVDLYIDCLAQPGKLVTGVTGGGVITLSGFYQGSHVPLRIFPLKATGRIQSAAYSPIAISGFGDVRIAVGDRAGSASPLAMAGNGTSYPATAVSTPDSDGLSNYWSVELNLNTTELNNAIGSSDAKSCFIEIAASVAGSYRVILQVPITIWAAVYDPTGAVSLPTTAAEYLRKEEVFALFVPWDSRAVAANAGKTILLTSPSGTVVRELGVANDGTPTDNTTV